MYSKTFVLFSIVFLVGCSSNKPNIERSVTIPPSTQSNNAKDALTKHNQIRLGLSIPPLVWDESLVKSAQSHANYLASRGKFEHASSGYGENLYGASYQASYLDAITSWSAEKQNYNYATNRCQGICGHYTQIVWRNSQRLGCAKATYRTGRFQGGVVIVCRYDPIGNYRGHRPY